MNAAASSAILASIPSPARGIFNVGPVPLHACGLCIAVGILLAVRISERRWERRGHARSDIADIVIAGIVGARLSHVVTGYELYTHDPLCSCSPAGDTSPSEPTSPADDTLGGMWRRAQCSTSHRPTYAGCGSHVEQVLGDIAESERCKCSRRPTCTSSEDRAVLVPSAHRRAEDTAMNTCGLVRLLGVAWLVGFAVSTLVGSSTFGWVAGLLTLVVVTMVGRVRGTGGCCAISPSGSAGVRSRATD